MASMSAVRHTIFSKGGYAKRVIGISPAHNFAD